MVPFVCGALEEWRLCCGADADCAAPRPRISNRNTELKLELLITALIFHHKLLMGIAAPPNFDGFFQPTSFGSLSRKKRAAIV